MCTINVSCWLDWGVWVRCVWIRYFNGVVICGGGIVGKFGVLEVVGGVFLPLVYIYTFLSYASARSFSSSSVTDSGVRFSSRRLTDVTLSGPEALSRRRILRVILSFSRSIGKGAHDTDSPRLSVRSGCFIGGTAGLIAHDNKLDFSDVPVYQIGISGSKRRKCTVISTSREGTNIVTCIPGKGFRGHSRANTKVVLGLSRTALVSRVSRCRDGEVSSLGGVTGILNGSSMGGGSVRGIFGAGRVKAHSITCRGPRDHVVGLVNPITGAR